MPDSHGSLSDHLEQLLQVEKFPPAGFATTAQVSDPAVDEQAAADPVAWWAMQARERLQWDTPFSLVLDDSNPPFYTWFADGTINVTFLASTINGSPGLAKAGGIAVFAFAAVGAYVFAGSLSVATGGKPFPLGRPVMA
jgi:Acetyl-coenzyme A synthetase N-terminus